LFITQGKILCQSCITNQVPHQTDATIISKIDVEKLVDRLSHIFDGGRDSVVAAVREFARFIHLKLRIRDWEGRWLSPSPLVDLVWREMIVDTRMYSKFCLDVCGGNILDHESIPTSIAQTNAKRNNRLLTGYFYRHEYGSPNEKIWQNEPEPAGNFIQIFIKASLVFNSL
jgi:hypothetical protein